MADEQYQIDSTTLAFDEIDMELKLEKKQSSFLEDMKVALEKKQSSKTEEQRKTHGITADDLPSGVIFIMASYLDHTESLVNCAVVCRHFYISL